MQKPPVAFEVLNTRGSVGMGMDTSSSDHDIFLRFKDGEQDMVQILYELVLVLQKQNTTHCRLKRAKIVRKDFAVEIQDYYRFRDFDLVPYTVKPGPTGLEDRQWDAGRKVWQRVLHSDLTPKLQKLSEKHPDGFSMTRLLKIYNESLSHLRKSGEKKKPPLISLDIPLMVLGALDQHKLDSCKDPQGYFLESLKHIRHNWARAEVAENETSLQEIGAEAHLQRMTKKYGEAQMEVEFIQLLDNHLIILEQLCAEKGNDKLAAERVIQSVQSLFGKSGPHGLLAREPSYKSKVAEVEAKL